jgi:V-type H+-transporting ATPase subunit a
MVSIFRSEEMSLLQFVIPHEVAHEAVKQVGTTGKVQFIDLNPNVSAFQKRFLREIPRADEMEKKLRYIISQIRQYPEIEIVEFQNFDYLEAMKASLIRGESFLGIGKPEIEPRMEDLADHLKNLEDELKALCVLEVDCKKSMLENQEFLKVLEAVKHIFHLEVLMKQHKIQPFVC